MVDPTDNSLRLASLDLEEDTARGLIPSTAKTQFGNRTSNGTRGNVKYFPPINNKRDLFIGIGLLLLVVISNILLTIGQCLITSIYFIYVPGHKELFTRIVNYFGRRTLKYFLMVVVIPFSTLNLLANGMIYMWRDSNFQCSAAVNPDFLSRTYSNSIRNHHDYYESGSSLHQSRQGSITISDLASQQDPSSLMLIPSPLDYPHHYGSNLDDYEAFSPRVLGRVRNIICSWRKVAVKDSFVLTSMFIWGMVIFITGIRSTITF